MIEYVSSDRIYDLTINAMSEEVIQRKHLSHAPLRYETCWISTDKSKNTIVNYNIKQSFTPSVEDRLQKKTHKPSICDNLIVWQANNSTIIISKI
jgi:hypothetical protein